MLDAVMTLCLAVAEEKQGQKEHIFLFAFSLPLLLGTTVGNMGTCYSGELGDIRSHG